MDGCRSTSRHGAVVMTFITQGGEGRGEKIRRGKLRKAKAEALKRGLVARSCARSGRKDVVGEVKGIEMMGVLIAGRGARKRGSRRLQVAPQHTKFTNARS